MPHCLQMPSAVYRTSGLCWQRLGLCLWDLMGSCVVTTVVDVSVAENKK